MRGVLCLCAALALWPVAPGAAPPRVHPDHIKRQILAKLGLSTRPTPLRAPPRDVVRQILAHAAADDAPPAHHHDDHNTREIIAIAQRAILFWWYNCRQASFFAHSNGSHIAYKI